MAPKGLGVHREPHRGALVGVERRALLGARWTWCSRPSWDYGLRGDRGLRRGPGCTPDEPECGEAEQEPARPSCSRIDILLMVGWGHRSTPSRLLSLGVFLNGHRPPAGLGCETPDQTGKSIDRTAQAYEVGDPGGVLQCGERRPGRRLSGPARGSPRGCGVARSHAATTARPTVAASAGPRSRPPAGCWTPGWSSRPHYRSAFPSLCPYACHRRNAP
jgi:hypothetical protein